jgi:hypothetical protein
MLDTGRDRDNKSPSFSTFAPEPPGAPLVVHMHRDAQSCIASFSGSLSDTTRVTIDGVADLIAGERTVVLDFSRVDEVEKGGAEAVEAMIQSMRARGTEVRMANPARGTSLHRQLGNFPQALSHVALVNNAANLSIAEQGASAARGRGYGRSGRRNAPALEGDTIGRELI